MGSSYAVIHTPSKWLCQGYNRLRFAGLHRHDPPGKGAFVFVSHAQRRGAAAVAPQSTKPTIGQIEADFLAQPAFGADADRRLLSTVTLPGPCGALLAAPRGLSSPRTRR